MIRITSGTFRSRLLKTPDSTLTKPTMDKVRLGVFSAIADRVNNAYVLDLFAGCGSYGFEALSRGAKSATFVDKGYEQVQCIKSNANNLNVNVSVHMRDVLSFLNETSEKYDLIFVDPPYKLNCYNEVVDLILKRNLLTDNGIIVLESEDILSLDETKFAKVKMYKYGLAKAYILRK
ncbi:MAG: 16S rRNA (guanine(966)-N(2))-methyltransferase RsmD [Bacilli bacterium]|nr:16S rRNA (guanine(966)-N(2))-methyltransferase RsmD [Bacilli bacterium]